MWIATLLITLASNMTGRLYGTKNDLAASQGFGDILGQRGQTNLNLMVAGAQWGEWFSSASQPKSPKVRLFLTFFFIFWSRECCDLSRIFREKTRYVAICRVPLPPKKNVRGIERLCFLRNHKPAKHATYNYCDLVRMLRFAY